MEYIRNHKDMKLLTTQKKNAYMWWIQALKTGTHFWKSYLL